METPSITQPQISKAVTEVIEFPEKDESQGEIAMSFVGPTYDDMMTRKVRKQNGPNLCSCTQTDYALRRSICSLPI